jgi:hypothetical protein
MPVFQLRANEKILLTATPNAAPVEPGSYTWSTNDPNLVDLFPQGDGSQCYVVAKDIPGGCTVVANADADPGPALALISGQCDLEILPGLSTELVITASAPEPR